jgi:hypothetical protein
LYSARCGPFPHLRGTLLHDEYLTWIRALFLI